MSNNKLLMCTIVLTRACNLRCGFCFKKSAGYGKKEIPFGKLKELVDFCVEAELKYIFLSGGEPLKYPHLFKALEYMKSQKHPLSTAIASNGTLLEDMDVCKKLVESGLDYIDISLKGHDGKSWKKATGTDLLKGQLLAIENLASLSVELTCSMVVTPENVAYVCNAVKTANDHGAKSFSFTFVIDNQQASIREQAYLEKNNPFNLIESFLLNHDRLNAISSDWWVEYSFPMCVYSAEQRALLEGKLAEPCQVHFGNAITVDADLRLLPCEMYLEQEIGRFGDDFTTIEEFIEHEQCAVYCKPLEELKKVPSKHCLHCAHFEICRGGCPVLWKNYSYDALQAFKDKWVQSKNL